MSNDLTPSSPIPAAPLPDENLQKPVNPGKSRYFPEIIDPAYQLNNAQLRAIQLALDDKGLGRFLGLTLKGPSLTLQLNPDIDDTTPCRAPKNPDGVSQHPLKSPNLPPHSQ
jgi:hypothetical protein